MENKDTRRPGGMDPLPVYHRGPIWVKRTALAGIGPGNHRVGGRIDPRWGRLTYKTLRPCCCKGLRAPRCTTLQTLEHV